jgi:hypothetical protein
MARNNKCVILSKMPTGSSEMLLFFKDIDSIPVNSSKESTRKSVNLISFKINFKNGLSISGCVIFVMKIFH